MNAYMIYVGRDGVAKGCGNAPLRERAGVGLTRVRTRIRA